MPKIYTRTGDEGETGLFAGGRIRKDDPRLEAIGTIDELNAALGVVRVELGRIEPPPADLDQFAERTQHQLFNLGAELAMPQPQTHSTNLIQDADVARLEEAIDRWEAELEPLREFILPGGCARRRPIALATMRLPPSRTAARRLWRRARRPFAAKFSATSIGSATHFSSPPVSQITPPASPTSNGDPCSNR